MIVVDSGMSLDFFHGRDESQVAELIALVEQDAGVALTDVIRNELLQGLRTDQQVRRVEERLKFLDPASATTRRPHPRRRAVPIGSPRSPRSSFTGPRANGSMT